MSERGEREKRKREKLTRHAAPSVSRPPPDEAGDDGHVEHQQRSAGQGHDEQDQAGHSGLPSALRAAAGTHVT